jgi:co-chaperonin GroES (HSP10)
VKNKKIMENISEKHVLPTKLLLKPAEVKVKTTPSGLVIPDVVKAVSCLGSIVLKGNKIEDINIGDNVLYSPNAIIKVKFEDEVYDLLSLADVLLYW